MNLEEALEIVHDQRMVAHADFIHEEVFRRAGRYDVGISPDYDRIVLAYAFVAIELAMYDGGLMSLPPEN